MRPSLCALVMLATAVAVPAEAQQSGLTAAALATPPSDIPVNCAIRPLQVVEIAAPMTGVIREVFVKPGDRVEKGSPIAEFNNDLERAALAAAETRAGMTAALAVAEARQDGLARKLARLERAAASRAVSKADVDAARLELSIAEGEVEREREALELAELEVERARVIVEKSHVVSPVAGVIGEDPIDPGESPTAKPIATIYVTQPLRVEAYVPTAYLVRFLERERFAVVVNGNRAAPVEVSMDHVSQVADLSSNTQSVFFTLQSPDILPGYQCLVAPPDQRG